MRIKPTLKNSHEYEIQCLVPDLELMNKSYPNNLLNIVLMCMCKECRQAGPYINFRKHFYSQRKINSQTLRLT